MLGLEVAGSKLYCGGQDALRVSKIRILWLVYSWVPVPLILVMIR